MKKKIFLTAIIIVTVLLSSCSSSSANRPIVVSANTNQGNTFENLNNMGYIASDGQYICCSFLDGRLCRFDLDGNNMVQILQLPGAAAGLSIATSLNILNGWIYYTNPSDDSINKVKIDGTDNQKISDIQASSLYVQGDILYAEGVFQGSNNNIYAMNLDGSNMQLLSDQQVDSFYVYGNFIYYVNEQGIGRMNPDGSGQSEITESVFGINWITIYANSLFYVNSGGDSTMYRVDLSSGAQQKFADLGDNVVLNTFNVYQNTFYYSTYNSSKSTLHILDMTTGKEKKVSIPFQSGYSVVPPAISDFVIGNKIFRDENGSKFYTMNLDGSNIKLFAQ